MSELNTGSVFQRDEDIPTNLSLVTEKSDIRHRNPLVSNVSSLKLGIFANYNNQNKEEMNYRNTNIVINLMVIKNNCPGFNYCHSPSAYLISNDYLTMW